MSDVYGHATITIAASRAADCTEGFLSDRTIPDYVPIPIQTSGHSGDIYAFVLPRKYAADGARCNRLEDEPLSSRGWAFQERYLSPRTLHFGHRQTFFECLTSFVAEDFCSVGRNQPGVRQMMVRSSWNHAWPKVVEEYTRRKLSFPEDKLPALAGLAHRLGEGSNESPEEGNRAGKPVTEYLAGLRWRRVIADLCWSLGRHEDFGERPPLYRAPSWSWVAVDGQVDCHQTYEQPLAIACGAHIELNTAESPLGKVNGGWLHLQASRLEPRSPKATPDSPFPSFFEFLNADPSIYMHPSWDAESYTLTMEQELLVVPLAWNKYLADQERLFVFGPFCLILTPQDHQIPGYQHIPGFRRVGSGLMQTYNPKPLVQFAERLTIAKDNGELQDMLLL
ncbi:hypothetical protein OQA88_13259 [Cercophora sp. LCS_1]